MKKILFTFLFLGFFCYTNAQDGNVLASKNSNNSSMTSSPNRWTFGGNIGIGGGFGTNNSQFDILVAPRVGYMITPQLNLGASVNYNYQSSKYYSTHIIGVGPELSYFFENIYLNTEYLHYYISQKGKNNSTGNYSHNENALYIGGGYRQNLGNNVYMHIGAKYNLLYNKDKSIFSSAFIPNVGIVFSI